jgi:hypothetical protein
MDHGLVQGSIVRDLVFSPSIAISLVLHVAALAWLGTRAPGPADPAHAPALQWIDIEVAPGLPEATMDERERPQPAQPPDVLPEPPAQPVVTPRLAVQQPRRRSEPLEITTARAEPPGSGDADSAPGFLSMRTTGSGNRPAEPRRDPGAGVPRLAPEQAARLVERDPGPPAWSPLAPPRSGKTPRARSEIVPDGKGAYRADDLTFTAKIDRDGRVHIEDKRNLQGGPTGGTFDVSDAIMRSAGQDPYYHRKALFLERTREQRAVMSVDERQVTLRDSLARLPHHLTEIWAHTAWPAAQRRRVIFELWDECAEQGPDDIVSAGTAARITIVAFIRRRMPQGGAHAYPEAEIQALNKARRSRQRFAPYP